MWFVFSWEIIIKLRENHEKLKGKFLVTHKINNCEIRMEVVYFFKLFRVGNFFLRVDKKPREIIYFLKIFKFSSFFSREFYSKNESSFKHLAHNTRSICRFIASARRRSTRASKVQRIRFCFRFIWLHTECTQHRWHGSTRGCGRFART